MNLNLNQPEYHQFNRAEWAAMTIARPVAEGRVLSSQDYKAGELVTWSEACKIICGFSKLGEALVQKIDPHAAFACRVLGIDLKDFDKKIKLHGDVRQAAKVPNFTKPGGGSVPTYVLQARMQGEDTAHPDGPTMIDDGKGNLIPGFKGLRFCALLKGEYCGGRDGRNKRRTWGSGHRERPIKPLCAMCLEIGEDLERTWKAQWPEHKPYFDHSSSVEREGMVIQPEYLEMWPWWKEIFEPYQQLEPMQLAQFWSGRVRKIGVSAEAPFCVINNSFFQALLADATKLAHRIAVRECYDRTRRVPSQLFWNSKRSVFAGMESPLIGSRIPVFAHDELIGDHPLSIAHEASLRISEIMDAALRYVCPHHAEAVEAEQTLMFSWSKEASKVVHNDRVVPWTREHQPKNCNECALQSARDAARKAAA